MLQRFPMTQLNKTILDFGFLQQGCLCLIELSFFTMQILMNLENGQVFQLFDARTLLLLRGEKKTKGKGKGN